MNDVLVLCYHAVSPRWRADLSIAPAALGRQLRALVRRGYRGATFSEAVTAPPAARTLAVTFDDAYRSVARFARPLLDELDLPATVFVPTAHAGSGRPMAWPGIDGWLGGEHEDELVPMDWPGLRVLASAGWEIGSHTHTHPHLTTLGAEELDAELRTSKEVCERELGQRCRSVAYPYGDVDGRVVRAAAAAGYETGAALPARLTPGDPMTWPRIGVYHGDVQWRFGLKASFTVRRLRAIVRR